MQCVINRQMVIEVRHFVSVPFPGIAFCDAQRHSHILCAKGEIQVMGVVVVCRWKKRHIKNRFYRVPIHQTLWYYLYQGTSKQNEHPLLCSGV